MAILTKEELLERMRKYIPEDAGEDDLVLLEDIDDTFTSWEGDNKENWKEKYEELDKTWREKYRARFFEKKKVEESEDDGGEERKYTYEELFKEKKEDA